MAKYSWNIEVIKDRIKYLQKQLELEKDHRKRKLYRYDIESLECYLDDFYDTDIEDRMKLLDGYDMVKNNLFKTPFIWNDIKEFKDITETPLIYIPNQPRSSLSKEDILNLTHDFYKSLNHEFFINFMKNFRRRFDHIAFRNPLPNKGKGCALTFITTDEAFINIYRDFTLDDVFTTIHEYMHTTSNCINKYHLCRPKNLYMEIDTIFAELIAADYLESIFKNGDPSLIRAYEHGRYVCIADELSVKIELLEYEKALGHRFKNNKELKLAAKEHCDVLGEEIDELFTSPNFSGKDYIVSYMFALELYKIYLNDKEKALYLLKKIILLECRSPEEYYSNIKKLGLFPNLSSHELHKQFTDEALTLTRKKPKN